MKYQCVLMATEPNWGDETLAADQYISIAKKLGRKLRLVHSLKKLSRSSEAYILPSLGKLEKKQLHLAKQGLAKLAKRLGIGEQDQTIEIGAPDDIILKNARVFNADLIVMENYRYATTVLRKAPCDILVVKR